jgi:hypothetical protein
MTGGNIRSLSNQADPLQVGGFLTGLFCGIVFVRLGHNVTIVERSLPSVVQLRVYLQVVLNDVKKRMVSVHNTQILPLIFGNLSSLNLPMVSNV